MRRTVKLLAGANVCPDRSIERRVGLHVEEPDVVAAQFAAQSRRPPTMSIGSPRRDSPIRREKNRSTASRLSELEQLRVLEEERTLLREKQRKACQVYLLFVCFDLCEIGVHGHIEGEVGADAPLDVEAHVPGPTNAIGARDVVCDRA